MNVSMEFWTELMVKVDAAAQAEADRLIAIHKRDKAQRELVLMRQMLGASHGTNYAPAAIREWTPRQL